jgi:hypothetical protein
VSKSIRPWAWAYGYHCTSTDLTAIVTFPALGGRSGRATSQWYLYKYEYESMDGFLLARSLPHSPARRLAPLRCQNRLLRIQAALGMRFMLACLRAIWYLCIKPSTQYPGTASISHRRVAHCSFLAQPRTEKLYSLLLCVYVLIRHSCSKAFMAAPHMHEKHSELESHQLPDRDGHDR